MRLIQPHKKRKGAALFCLPSANSAAARKRFTGKMLILVLIATATACLRGGAFAGPAISARYLQTQGEHIVWEIQLASPQPLALIVTQYLLPGTEILESSYPLSSCDKEKGIAKWLITSISPGTLKMEMTVSKPIRRKGEIHGEVMFEDESRNTTVSILISPAEP